MSKNSTLILAIVGITSAALLSACASLTPGRAAVQQGDTAQLKKILAQPNHGGEDINRLFDDSVLDYDCPECASILLQAGAKAVAGGFWSTLPAGLDSRLARAAIDGHEKVAQVLIDHGAEPTAAIKFCVNPASVKEFFAKLERDRAAKAAADVVAAPTADEVKPEPSAEQGKQWWGK